ncbi:MAG: lipopolysaccharide transport system permease [Prolixibacteraceae bacterium]|nr:MAG: lipopolysaccharide transport system permease [Prolixibacteraceae bacterium]
MDLSRNSRLSKGKIVDWDIIIKPQTSIFEIDLKEIWRYRDLLMMFVKRDIVTFYKQTILGPLWFFIQPLFTTLMFIVVFSGLAGISTNGLPQGLFYMAGILCWNYFSDCLIRTSTTFKENQQIFGKVYFPRIVVPLSIIIANLVRFGIQFILFIAIYLYYLLQGVSVHPNSGVLFFPVLILIMAGLALGFGMIITAMTTKYKDLVFLVQFGVQLWMYATPVIYPLSATPEKYRWLIVANPMTAVVETFKYGFLNQQSFEISHLLYSFVFMILILSVGTLVFNKVEKGFMDTI